MTSTRSCRRLTKLLIIILPLTSGTMLGTSCYDLATLANPCGGALLTNDVCTEQDWWSLTFGGRTNPNYFGPGGDMSCTVPGQCGQFPANPPTGGGGP
jgi:hypothetical protein